MRRSLLAFLILGFTLSTVAAEAPAPKPKRIAILLFDGVQPLDFVGPLEVFGGAVGAPGVNFEVFTVSETGGIITTEYGLRVQPAYSIDNAPPIDVLIIPGGAGAEKETSNRKLVEWIRRRSVSAEHVASVCTGAYLLVEAGIVDGTEVTTHHWAAKRLQKRSSRVTVISGPRFIDNGKFLSAGGISAGIDLSFHLLEKLAGAKNANWVREFMEYGAWQKPAAEKTPR